MHPPRMHARTHAHTHTHTRIQTDAHTYTHAYRQMHTHAHTHAYIYKPCIPDLMFAITLEANGIVGLLGHQRLAHTRRQTADKRGR